ncbi:MAG: FAD-binding oxidoreductase, partial [Promethearchaeota archaeon]
MISLTQFTHGLAEAGFIDLRDKPFGDRQKFAHSGWGMVLENPVHGGSLKDCSLLHFLPAIILRPKTVVQLQHIVTLGFRFQIPLTFAAGKTGLSAGYANPYCVVDLEGLHTLPAPIVVDLEHHMITVDQHVLVSALIRLVPMKTDDLWIFPTQPSSSFKLPVRIGGLIATDASGVTSGKLGPIKDWVSSMHIMTPKGDIQTVTREDTLFAQIIGGDGQFGVILSAEIRLAPNPQESVARVLFGYNLEEVFNGLQHVQNARVFPLLSEFVLSTTALIGKFAQLFEEREGREGPESKPGKWAILLKGNLETVDRFTHLISQYAALSVKDLNATEFQILLEERASLALQTVSSDRSKAFVRYPGFDDLLMDPGQILPVFKVVNQILASYGFPNMIVGYGHVNFRKGQGLLLHLRLPVALDQLASDPQVVYP